MKKTLTIGERRIVLECNAGTSIRYRQKFGRDLMRDMQSVAKGKTSEITSGKVNTFFELMYIMALQADLKAIRNGKKAPNDVPSEYVDFLEDFEVMPMEEVIPEVVELWAKAQGTTVEVKKKSGNR